MGLPPVVVGLIVYLYLSRSGPFGFLGLLYTPSAMIIAQSILIIPIIGSLSCQILEDLDEESLVKILLEPKNSLIKQYQELFKLEGVKLTFRDSAIKEIAVKAIKKKTGARGLRSILENILLKTMFDLPGQEDTEEVIIDTGAVKGHSQPIIVHSKNNKSKSDKTSAA